MARLNRQALRVHRLENNRLLDRPHLWDIFWDLSTLPERFTNAWKTYDPEALVRNQAEIIKFLKREDGHDMELVVNDDFNRNQRQAILDEYDEFIDDLNFLQGRISVYFDWIEFTPDDVEREWDKILNLYQQIANKSLDRWLENMSKVDQLLRDIATYVMLRRQNDAFQIWEDPSVKKQVWDTLTTSRK